MMNVSASQCFLCSGNAESFKTLIPHSLYNKYSSSQNFYYIKDMDSIINEELSTNYIQFREFNYLDEDDEYLKRQYHAPQYSKKIGMLSQYYKFHRDLPVWNQRSVELLMERYYTKLKDVDYKKIKRILKQEQNISISTHKSFSSFDDSESITKRSHYSTMLNDLNLTKNQSLILMDFCEKIGRAFKKVKGQPLFKGNFISSQRKFQQYLKRQDKKKESYLKKPASKRNSLGFKKFNPKFITKNDEQGLRQINFTSTQSINNRRYKGKSIQKTTANQTISREEKVKTKRQKNNYIQINSVRNSISNQRNIHTSESCKLFKIKNIKALIGNENLKTINEIYKPTEQTELTRKQSHKLISKIKNRSNSHHNLPTNSSRNRQSVIIQSKLTRTNSQRMPKSILKASTIELDKVNSAQKFTKTHISRSSSLKKMSSNSKLEKEQKHLAQKSNKFIPKQKNSVIENMLEKKLSIAKKKQPIL